MSAVAAALVLSACGGGNVADDSTRTASSPAADSSADARQRAQAAPSSLAVKITTAPDALLQNLTIPADAATRGMWSTIQKWPLNAAHLALLPDGKVLSYGTAPGQPNVPNGRSFDFWTPSAGFGTAAHRLVSTPNGADTFGSSAAERKDGNLVIVGGVSTRSTTLVRWATGEVVDEGSKLIDDRWYATAMTQQDGSIYVAAGMTANSEAVVLGNGAAGSLAGVRSYNTEEYNQGAGWSSVNTFNASNGEDVFSRELNSASPQAWVSPHGQPFGMAGSQVWHHAFPVYSLAYFKSGGILGQDVQGAPFGALAAAALVRPGEILFAGGGSSNANDGAAATEKAALLDTNPNYDPEYPEGATFDIKPVYLPSMAFARRAANATLMADGQLVVTGGTRLGNASDDNAVRAAEIFNPVSRTWMTAASANAPRVHHSAALLLPNGAVLTAGGGVMTDAGREDAEVFYPPYLFRTVNGVAQLAPRPVITGLNAMNFGHGGAVKVELAAGHKASRIRLVRAGTVSRGFNNGQRPIELAVTQSGDTVSTVMPINPSLAPPGHYLLHVINEAGVPSVAQIVGLGLEGSTNVVVPLVSPYAVMSLRSIGSPDLLLSGQGAGPAGLVASPANQPVPASAELMLTWRPYDRDPGEFIDPVLGERCYFVRQRGSTSGAPRWLQPDAASTSTYNWVNFAFPAFGRARSEVCLEPSPIGRGLLLRSKWDPSKLMRVVNGKLRLEKEKATTAFITSASFELNLLRVLPPLQPVISYTPFPFPKTIPFGARIKVTATATDPDGVKLITLRECSDLQVRKSSTTGTVTYDWRPGVGPRQLCIRAVDTNGYESNILYIPFSVLPNALPTVSLTAPSNGSVLVTGQPISLTSQASDADGPILRVEFFDGTKLIGTASAAPWSVTWTPTTGSHTLTAKAVDNSDVSTTSAAVVVSAQ